MPDTGFVNGPSTERGRCKTQFAYLRVCRESLSSTPIEERESSMPRCGLPRAETPCITVIPALSRNPETGVKGDDYEAGSAPRLIINVRPNGGTVEMEFLAVFEEENLEDRLAYLGEQAETLDEREISFRLLRHYASSVRPS